VLSLTIAGFVMAARKHFPWRRPLIWTAILSIVPIAGAVVRFRSSLFTYDTSIGWDTFFNSQLVSAFVLGAAQIGILFLALAGIEAAHPQALDWLRREGRARFGRSALASALIALGVLLIWRVALQWLAFAFPSIASTGGFSVPQSVNMAAPALLAIGQAAVQAIIASAIVALFVIGLRGIPHGERYADVVAIVTLFFLTIDSSAHGAEVAFMLLTSATAALLAWALVRFVLRDNFLAYPLVAALASLLASAATMLENHRPDLTVNAVVVIVAAFLLAGWFALPSLRDVT